MILLRRTWFCAAFAFTFVSAVSSLNAQATFELSPLFGYYAPTAPFAPATVYSSTLPNKPSDLSGTAWGAEASLRLGGRFGVQVLAAIANSTLPQVITPGGPFGPTPAQVLVFTAQARYELSPDIGGTHFWLSGGPGVVRHQGRAYSENGLGAPVSVGAAFGVGTEVPIVRHLAATAGLEILLYQLDIASTPQQQANPGKIESGFQRDLLPHLGLVWRW
jgi:hypothetical protein